MEGHRGLRFNGESNGVKVKAMGSRLRCECHDVSHEAVLTGQGQVKGRKDMNTRRRGTKTGDEKHEVTELSTCPKEKDGSKKINGRRL